MRLQVGIELIPEGFRIAPNPDTECENRKAYRSQAQVDQHAGMHEGVGNHTLFHRAVRKQQVKSA